jgi:hypothetical protein
VLEPPVPSPPLTHHEILTLVEPFARRGRHADLAATDRLARKLVFKPVEHAATDAAPPLSETLELENPHEGFFRLTRTLVCAAAPQSRLRARLVAEGKQPADLLARVDAVAPASQFGLHPGFSIARSYRLTRRPGAAPDDSAAERVLIEAAAEIGAFAVAFTAPMVAGYSDADIAVAARDGGALAFPDDLLAVLGRDWGLLQRGREGWKASLRLRGREPARSLRAAAQIDQLCGHLAGILAAAPARFHERFAFARWRVALHRATPLVLYTALICAAFAATGLHMLANSPERMLIFNAAPILVMLILATGKRPQIEVPPPPRRSTAPDWREQPAGSAPEPPPGSPQPLRRG